MSVKEAVLDALRKNSGSFLSGEELSDRLDVSRAAVWKSINTLREEGYIIEAVRNRGYMMQEDTGQITPDSLRSILPHQLRNNDLHVYDCLDSTNLEARRRLLDNSSPPSHGDVIIARQQTAGRGRLGRSFFSPSHGLYMSIIVKPDFSMEKSTLVTLAAAAAVAEAVADVCGLNPEIKWVNDIYCEGRKVCGILTEATTDFESGQIDSLIIGIGLNTSHADFPKEIAGTAGRLETEFSQSHLAAHIIEGTLNNVAELSREAVPSFMEAYRKRSMVIGKTITVYKGVYRKDPSREINGIPARALSIDDSGGLEVMYTDGTREVLTSGEISVRLQQGE